MLSKKNNLYCLRQTAPRKDIFLPRGSSDCPVGIVSSDKYYGLDYILGLVCHKIEGFLNLIEAVESVTDQMGGVESAGLDYGHQALQTKSAAHLEATNKGNVVYKGTSIRNREGYGLVKLIAAKIGDGAAALDHLVGFGQIVLIATCENYLVYPLATGELKHLLGNRSIFVVDDIGCTIRFSKPPRFVAFSARTCSSSSSV